MSAISWTAIEDAIQKWVRSAANLSGKVVLWDYQKGDAPNPPYIALAIRDTVGVGRDWRVYDDAPDAVDGAELRVRVRGHRVATLAIQVFGPEKQGSWAMKTLTDVIAALPLHEYAIDVAGAGIGEASPVRAIPSGGGFLEPRATAEVTLHLASELEGRETYVQRMFVTVQAKNPAGDDLEARSSWVPTDPGFSLGFSEGFES